MKRPLSERVGQVFIHILLLLFSIACIYPFLLTLMVSFTSEKSLIHNGFLLFPKEFSTTAYELIFKDSAIYTGYGVSIIVTTVGTVLSLMVCGLAGYAMSIQKLRYRNAISMYFYIPMVFSAGLLPWYLVCTQILHLQNTIWALILPMLVSPFNVFLMRNGAIRTFFQIVLPLATPIIATVSLFIGLGYWNDWSHALYFVNDKNLYPLQYMLYRIKAMMEFVRQNGAMAGMEVPAQTYQIATLFVTIGPIVLMYPFVQRYFVKGIMVGAVKG